MRGFFGGLRGYRHFADQRFTGSAWTEKISDRVVYGLQNGEYFNRFRVIKVNQIVLVSMVQVNICRKFVLRETNSSSIRRRCLHFLHSWPREWQTIGLDSQLSTEWVSASKRVTHLHGYWDKNGAAVRAKKSETCPFSAVNLEAIPVENVNRLHSSLFTNKICIGYPLNDCWFNSMEFVFDSKNRIFTSSFEEPDNMLN